MHILTCVQCHQSYLDVGYRRDPLRTAWFKVHGESCKLPPLPHLSPAEADEALRMLAHVDTRMAH